MKNQIINLKDLTDLVAYSEICVSFLKLVPARIICTDGTDKKYWISEAERQINDLKNVISKHPEYWNDTYCSIPKEQSDKVADIVKKLNLIDRWVECIAAHML